MSGSAIFYVAMAKDSDGVVHSCNSMDLTCKIEGLKCSTNYTAYVIASNFMCNSSESETVTIETGTVRLLVLLLLLGYFGSLGVILNWQNGEGDFWKANFQISKLKNVLLLFTHIFWANTESTLFWYLPFKNQNLKLLIFMINFCISISFQNVWKSNNVLFHCVG